MTPAVRLTPEQTAFFHREGYLALGAIMTPEEVDWLKDIYDRLFERKAGREVGDQFDLGGTDEEGKDAVLPQILNPSRYAPEMRQGSFYASASGIARQLMGEEAAFQFDHAILKPARTGAATPWHQDEAYGDGAMDYPSISIWIPLQPATPENGCMQFVPGSHRWEVLPHHCIGHNPQVHGLEMDEADISTAVACPLPAGGATAHHHRTLHYTGPNLSDTPRRALVLVLGLPGVLRSEPRDFYWNRQKQTPRQERARAARRKEEALQP
ncbi:MAG: phytanoyl-CoA dioxygenase family protein [Armatimonadetes bacterium]|nr:phytanoyl-CoA dioxygenase family protein [Armatimonadota bacterium]